jgi:SHS2 domain-containing protein
MQRWEHFRHEADIGVRGFGATPARAFEQAALAMTAVIVPPEEVRQVETAPIEVQGPDLELLLFSWLNAVIFEMDTRNLLFGRYEATIRGDRLTGTAFGEPIDIERHRPAVEIKAATFAELKVARDGAGWLAQCVVDV